MITTQKHTPKPSRTNRANLEAKRRQMDRESRAPLNLSEHLGEDAPEFTGRRAVAACFDPKVHVAPVKVFDPRTALA